MSHFLDYGNERVAIWYQYPGYAENRHSYEGSGRPKRL